ncbi:unnamed protein product [Musa textilis]
MTFFMLPASGMLSTILFYLVAQGFAIGNGQSNTIGTGIIEESDYKSINKIYPAYELAIELCGTSKTVSCLASLLFLIVYFKVISYRDIRKQCEGSLCYDFSSSPWKRHLGLR